MKNNQIEKLTENIDEAVNEFMDALKFEGYCFEDIKDQVLTVIDDLVNTYGR